MPLWLRVLLAVALLLVGAMWWRVPRLRGWLRIALVVAALLAIVVTWWPWPRPAPPDWASVPRWLTCIDCTTGELDSLVALAGREPVSTVQLLSDALLLGLGDDRTRDFRRTLTRMYRRDSTFAAQRDTSLHMGPRDEYVEGYLGRFDRTWRARAALGLGRIHYVFLSLPPVSGAGAQALAALGFADSVITNVSVRLAIARAQDTFYIRDSLRH